jgi:sulfofructose kinase
MSQPEIIVIGRSCTDYIAVLDRYPDEDTKAPLQFRLKEGGGQGGTTSCCIAKLGGKVVYVGKLGDDEEGRFCLKRLNDFKVNTQFIDIAIGHNTPIAYLFVTRSTGKRTIIYEPNDLPKIEMTPGLKEMLLHAKVVLLDPDTTYLGPDLLDLPDLAPVIIYDAERWRNGVRELMQKADYFIPSSVFLDTDELQIDAGSLFQKIWMLNEKVTGTLIVTHGEQGAYYIEKNHLYNVAAPSQVKVIDTIGAGDNFHAAFTYAIAHDYPLPQAVKLAVAVASLSCQAYGGREGIPNLEEAHGIVETLETLRIE